MENYNDEKLAENFETIARAYSKSMKNKGFVFIKLEEEEFSLLLDEINVIFSKIMACLEHLKGYLDCNLLKEMTIQNQKEFSDKFNVRCKNQFENVENPTNCFLSLISLENMLTLKLMILSVKSGELEFCQGMITKRTRIYASSFSLEGFVMKDR